MQSLQWRVFYDDGSTYDSHDGPVESAPCEGVIIIAQQDADVGREILHIKDFYVWDGGRWWGCDRWGMEDYLRRPGWKKVLAGRNTAYANYAALYRRACTDPEFPPKSALLLTEAPMR